MKKVVIVNGDSLYERMYTNRGFEIIDTVAEADLIQFTGGEDVSPHYYGEGNHPRTFSNEGRDSYEAQVFSEASFYEIPKVGICRGGQFLNVMCGGKMLQDVNGHATGRGHTALDFVTNRWYKVSSTHHQMMVPNPVSGFVVGGVYGLSSSRDVWDGEDFKTEAGPIMDTEVVVYPSNKTLCFQPHPEYEAYGDCQDWFFDLLQRYLGV